MCTIFLSAKAQRTIVYKGVFQTGKIQLAQYEVIEAANEHSIAMIFTGMRHFKH